MLDLRAVCTGIADFANEIEPSSTGGSKIAQMICAIVPGHDFTRGLAALYP